MATYANLMEQLNEAAVKKSQYADELKTCVEEFTRQINRVWEANGKVQFGIVRADGIFHSDQIDLPDNAQVSKFVIAVEYEVEHIPKMEYFPMSIQKTHHGILVGLQGGGTEPVDLNQPGSFLNAINALQGAAFAWALREREKARLL